MKKAYLKWIIPVIVLYVMVGAACPVFGGFYKNEVIETELSYLSKSLIKGLNTFDKIVKTVIDYNDAMAVCFIECNLEKDQESLTAHLSALAENEYVVSALACDLEGKGIDNKGNDVVLGQESFFSEIQSKYESGGKGIVQIHEGGYFPENNLVIVNQIDYSDGEKGYLITDMDISSMASILFPEENMYEDIALVSLTGQIIAGKDGGANFFEKRLPGVQPDAIKLNISQKKEMITEIPGYGYIIMEPSEIAAASTIAIIEKSVVENHPAVQWRLDRYRWFVIALMVIIAVYTALNYLGYYIIWYIKRKREERESKRVRIDQLTELYNEYGVRDEIQKYINGSRVDKGAVLFVVSLDVEEAEDKEKIMKSLAGIIPQKHRLTDVLGRGDDDRFLIFLKDITEAKDIRKLSDELQLFLYDFKTEMGQENIKIAISAGRSIYPRDGGSADELLEAARKALLKSTEEGKENISINS